MASITDAELQALEADLDTPAILRAMDVLDRLRVERAELAGSDEGEGGLFAIRDELLQLHRSAQATLRSGTSADARELFDLAQDLQLQIGEWADALGGIQATLSTITGPYPESLAYED